MQSNHDDHKAHNFSLPKTAATISNKTQNFITHSNQTINGQGALTHKELNTHHAPTESVQYDKKYLSKQLLSQIHFCRFLYKLIIRMKDKLSVGLNEDLLSLKEYMTGLIFEKLEEVTELKAINSKYVQDYRNTPDYHKINQIIEQYITKYKKDLGLINKAVKPLGYFKE